MARRRAAIASALALGAYACAAHIVACSSSVPTIKSYEACADLAKAQCTESQACAPAEFQALYADEVSCEAREEAACTNALEAPSTALSGTLVEQCAQAYAAWTCPSYRARNTPQECLPPIGARSSGAACAFSGQCESAFCAVGAASVCGVCAPRPQPGDVCASNATACGAILVCLQSVCTAPATQGQPCDAATPCVGGESCVGAMGAMPGFCEASGSTAGAACDATLATGPDCAASVGLTCVAGQCAASGAAAAAFAADGASCDAVAGPPCAAPARCVVADGGTAGTCQLPNAGACDG